MILTSLRRPALTLAAASLALAVAGCGKKDDTTAATTPSSASAIAPIAPPAGQQWSDTVAETAQGGYVIGNPNAPIKLVEYGSLSCPHCARLAQEGDDPLLHKYVDSGRVSWEFRSFAIHPQDIPLTVLAECGGKDRFFPLMLQIYANFDKMNEVLNDKAALDRAQAAGSLPPKQRFVAISQALGYTDFFAKRGLSVDQANSCLADTDRAQKVADNSNKYSSDGVNSTPTLLINGANLELTVGAEPWTELEAALQRAGAR
ncbi:thioredoxin domain-containing protein [Tsuneonella mangrovi]|uniref:thioredoxin domain-containing protein n=1 Tax=Tsuneonella mangrovi TaxID=1982042 RepID=UPI000BA2923C|nr:thioredoxin domain-containing protein [Tsuneonella mangrovi]